MWTSTIADHEVRAPAVHGAQEPAERLLVVEGLQAVPGLVGRRHVDEREADAGDDLEHEERQRGAAEDVPPARRAARHADASAAVADRRAPSCSRCVEPVARPRGSGARRAPSACERSPSAPPSVGICRRWIAELAVLDLVVVLEEAARRRAGGARAVRVVGAAVAGAHEEPRLREPAHRAAEVRAVDGEDLELLAGDAPHPAGMSAVSPSQAACERDCGRWPAASAPRGTASSGPSETQAQ